MEVPAGGRIPPLTAGACTRGLSKANPKYCPRRGHTSITMSKTRSIHHIVFATKRRESTIPEIYKRELYNYIMGILTNKKCHLLRMNGRPDHIHILVDIHPTVALADLVKTVKQSSGNWLRNHPHFSMFDKWAEGYYAVSVGVDGIEACRNYIVNQEIHHQDKTMIKEMEEIAKAYGLAWHPDDWF